MVERAAERALEVFQDHKQALPRTLPLPAHALEFAGQLGIVERVDLLLELRLILLERRPHRVHDGLEGVEFFLNLGCEHIVVLVTRFGCLLLFSTPVASVAFPLENVLCEPMLVVLPQELLLVEEHRLEAGCGLLRLLAAARARLACELSVPAAIAGCGKRHALRCVAGSQSARAVESGKPLLDHLEEVLSLGRIQNGRLGLRRHLAPPFEPSDLVPVRRAKHRLHPLLMDRAVPKEILGPPLAFHRPLPEVPSDVGVLGVAELGLSQGFSAALAHRRGAIRGLQEGGILSQHANFGGILDGLPKATLVHQPLGRRHASHSHRWPKGPSSSCASRVA